MTTTFKEAYEVLSRNAQALREQNEPNIDDLLTIVNESVAAYKVCQERIAAVDAALQAALKDTGSAPQASTAQDGSDGGLGDAPQTGTLRGRGSAASATRSEPNGSSKGEDDVPF